MIEENIQNKEEFIKIDPISGRKGFNPLNKEKLSSTELDKIFNCWMYRGE